MPSNESLFCLSQFIVLILLLAITAPAIWNRRGTQAFLCGDCRFNDPNLCHKIERPKAIDCTSYRSTTN